MAGSISDLLESHAEQLQATPTEGGLTELIRQLTVEGLISMKDAAKMYGRNTHKSTPTRHAQKGVRAGGRLVRLEAIRVSGSLCTSRAAVLRFFAAQNATPDEFEPAPAPTLAERNRAAAEAHQQLAAALGTAT